MATASRLGFPADPPYSGVITRRLGECSFETDDPVTCADWLRELDYIDVPRHGPREHARLQLKTSTAIVYLSGLVICLPGVH
jgi:hypothetical protein